MRSITSVFAAIGILLCASAASAEYPDRTINVLVPFGAGGGTDVPARFFALEMEEILGQNIVVSNVEGAGGTVGATQLSQAEGDGYSLGFMPVGTMTTQPHLKKTSYNADSWTPVCMVSQGPFYLVVAEDSPIETVDDYIAAANGEGIPFRRGRAGFDVPRGTADPRQEAWNHDTVHSDQGWGRPLPPKSTGVEPKQRRGSRISAPDSGGGPWRSCRISAPISTRTFPRWRSSASTRRSRSGSVSSRRPARLTTSWPHSPQLASRRWQRDRFQENMAGANRLIRYMDTASFGPFFREAFALNGQLLRDAGLLK